MCERAKVHNKSPGYLGKAVQNVGSCSSQHTESMLNTYPDTHLQNAGLNKTGSLPQLQFSNYSRHMSVTSESDFASTSETHVSKPGHLVEQIRGVEPVDKYGQSFRLVYMMNDTQDERTYHNEGHSRASVTYSGHMSANNVSDLDRTFGDAWPKNNVSQPGHPVEQTGIVPYDRSEQCLGQSTTTTTYLSHMPVNNESDWTSTYGYARPQNYVSEPGNQREQTGLALFDRSGKSFSASNDTQAHLCYQSAGQNPATPTYINHMSVKNESELTSTYGDARPKNYVSEPGNQREQTGLAPFNRSGKFLRSADENNGTQTNLAYHSDGQSTTTTVYLNHMPVNNKSDLASPYRDARPKNYVPESGHQGQQTGMRSFSNEYIEYVKSSCDVVLEREMSYSSDKTEVTKRLCDNKVIWLASNDREMVIEMNLFDKVQASEGVVPYLHQQGEKLLERKGDMVMVEFPNRTGENQIHTSELESIMMELLRKASDKGEQSLAIPLLPVANWTLDEYMRSAVNTSVHWLLNPSSSNSSLLKVVLFTESQDWFRNTNEFLEKRIMDMLKGSEIWTMNPQIRLIKGHLDQTEADVLVNTTAYNLDLSYGEVSNAILKTAGPHIQHECWQQYPNGIKLGDIAVTSGYNLKCKQVFHVTLLMYSKEMEIESIQCIRKAMLNCLKQAAAYKFSSVAFPAIGTGKLGYPKDTVLAEMFRSVQRFRINCPYSTLKEVLFVIYPKDVDLCQKFERHEDKIRKEVFEAEAKPIKKRTVRIFVTGQKDDVRKAREMLESKDRDLLLNDDDVVAEVGADVPSSVFSALQKQHKQDFKIFEEDGVRTNYSESRGRIELHGKRGRVGKVLITVKGFVERLLAMQTEETSMDRLNEQVAMNVPEAWQFGKNSSYNKHDGHVPKVTPFENRVSDIEKARSDLSRASVDVDFICKSVNEMTPSERDEEEMDTSENETVIHDTGTSFQTPAVKRKFSWSKDVSCLDIFERGNLVVKVYRANILHIPVTVIVNPANRDLNHCGGLSKAVAEEAGSSLVQECQDIYIKKCPLPVSSVVCTSAGKLHFKYIFHAIGPSWTDYSHNTKEGLNKCCEDLKQTVFSCLKMADTMNLESIGMSAISSGSFKVPKDICATQYADAILEFSGRNNMLREIHIVDLNLDMIDIIHKVFYAMFREGKPSPFSYTITSKTSVETNADKSRKDTQICQTENFKPTGRSRPTVSQPSDTRTEIATYKSDGNKSVMANDSGSITQEDVPQKGESLKNSTQPAVVDDCVICMDKVTDGKKLNCGHIFCKECIEGYFRVKKVCPTCGTVCGIITGDQPDGQMDICKRPTSVAGFEQYECIAITYCFENGIQTTDHPRPGTPYKGITRTAYLPDSMEGREICAMLIVAFQRRLIFTIGTSRTTGKESVITWNDIHHKTNPRPNTQFGYPDKTYLQRVREELEVKGVIAKDIDTKLIKNLEKYNFRHTVYARME